MQDMLYRICWNTNGWQRPTGSANDNGYPGKNGFGHEEWNFCFKDIFNDYIYAFLYFKPSNRVLKKTNNTFKIGFWTFNPYTNEKILVGVYNNAEYIRDKDLEYKKLDEHFKVNNIYKRRIKELLIARPEMIYKRAKNEIEFLVSKKGLSYRCPVDKVKTFDINDNLVLPDEIDGKKVSHRFTTPTYINSLDNLIDEIYKKDNNLIPFVEDGYYREVSDNLKYITKEHNKLLKRLTDWLSNNDYKEICKKENRVDIECLDLNDNLCRFEIKITANIGTTRSIRESLGQLLEYNFYGARKKADRWIIILDKEPTYDDIIFLKKLKNKYKMPLEIGWLSKKSFIFNELI